MPSQRFQVSMAEVKTDKSVACRGSKFSYDCCPAIREGAGLTTLPASFHCFPFDQANNEMIASVAQFLQLPCCRRKLEAAGWVIVQHDEQQLDTGLLKVCLTLEVLIGRSDVRVGALPLNTFLPTGTCCRCSCQNWPPGTVFQWSCQQGGPHPISISDIGPTSDLI